MEEPARRPAEGKVVFDDHEFARDAHRLVERALGVLAMVEDIDQRHRVERAIGEGDVLAVVRRHVDERLLADRDVHAGDLRRAAISSASRRVFFPSPAAHVEQRLDALEVLGHRRGDAPLALEAGGLRGVVIPE